MSLEVMRRRREVANQCSERVTEEKEQRQLGYTPEPRMKPPAEVPSSTRKRNNPDDIDDGSDDSDDLRQLELEILAEARRAAIKACKAKKAEHVT